MSDRIKEIITRESVQTLEKLAFIFAMPEEEDTEPEGEEAFAVAVDFTGPFSGSMLIRYPVEDLDELAVNMLGIDDEEEITGDQKIDALKETVNIICGNVLPAIGGKTAVFDISAPMFVDESEPRPDISAAVKVQLGLDEGMAFIFLMFDDGVPEIEPEQ